MFKSIIGGFFAVALSAISAFATNPPPFFTQSSPSVVYSVADYGGICNGNSTNGTADTTAINRIFSALRALPNNSSHPTIIFPGNPTINNPVGNACYITSTINATSAGGGGDALSSQNHLTIQGGRLECHTTGTPCFDMSGARFYDFEGTLINSPSGAEESSYGLQIARLHTGVPAGDHFFNHVKVQGFYTKAAVISFASELNTWIAPFMGNSDTLNSTSNYTFVDDGCNHFNLTSAFQTLDIGANIATSDLQDNYIGGQISSGAGGSIIAPLFVCNTLHHEYKNVYINSNSSYAVHLFNVAPSGVFTGVSQSLYFDLHVETGPTIQNIFYIEDNAATNVVIPGFYFHDSAANASVSVFKAASNLTSITFHKLDVEVDKFSQGAAVQLWDQPTLYAADGGTIYLPSITNWQPPSATFTSNSSETVCLIDQNPVCQTPIPTISLNRNPNFLMDQPNEGATNLVAANGAIVTDGWHEANSGALLSSITFVRDSTTGPPNNLPFFYNLQATITSTKSITTTNFYNIYTNIEGADMAPLRWGLGSQGAPLIVDYCLQSSVVPVTIPVYLANSAANQFYTIDNVISTANTWQCFTNLVPADQSGAWAKTPNSTGLRIGISFGNGPTNNASCVANTWQSTTCYSTPNSTNLISEPNSTVYHIGSVRTYNSFVDTTELTPAYSTLLENSQRWYRKSFVQSVKPVQNVASSLGAVAFQAPYAQATFSTATQKVSYPPMFTNNGGTTPTITFFSTNAASANCYNVTKSADAGAAATVNNSESGFLLQCTLASGNSLGDQLQVHYTADSGF